MERVEGIGSVDIVRTDSKFLPVLPNVLPVPVAVQGLPHVECILAASFVLGGAVEIITVVHDHGPEHGVAHILVHIDGELVAGADVEVDEPGGGLIAGAF